MSYTVTVRSLNPAQFNVFLSYNRRFTLYLHRYYYCLSLLDIYDWYIIYDCHPIVTGYIYMIVTGYIYMIVTGYIDMIVTWYVVMIVIWYFDMIVTGYIWLSSHLTYDGNQDMLLAIVVGLNIFYLGIEYTEKYWVRPKMWHFPLQNLVFPIEPSIFFIHMSCYRNSSCLVTIILHVFLQ